MFSNYNNFIYFLKKYILCVFDKHQFKRLARGITGHTVHKHVECSRCGLHVLICHAHDNRLVTERYNGISLPTEPNRWFQIPVVKKRSLKWEYSIKSWHMESKD